MLPTTKIWKKENMVSDERFKCDYGCAYFHTKETQAHDRNYAYVFQMNNGSLYTSEPSHEID